MQQFWNAYDAERLRLIAYKINYKRGGLGAGGWGWGWGVGGGDMNSEDTYWLMPDDMLEQKPLPI